MFENIGDNLNLLMAKARINSTELARAVGLPATTIKRIRNNEQKNPTVGTLLPIAKYFSITISQLLQCEQLDKHESSHDLKAIPILSWRDCVHFNSLDYKKLQNKILTERNVSDKSYCLVVEDRDLHFFPENSLLIIEPERIPESGDYIVVTKNKQGIALIKKYIVETDQTYLKSLVDGSGITPLTPEYKILGVILQYKVELRK